MGKPTDLKPPPLEERIEKGFSILMGMGSVVNGIFALNNPKDEALFEKYLAGWTRLLDEHAKRDESQGGSLGDWKEISLLLPLDSKLPVVHGKACHGKNGISARYTHQELYEALAFMGVDCGKSPLGWGEGMPASAPAVGRIIDASVEIGTQAKLL